MNYEEAYQKLNKNQQKAVTSLDGAVMVVAGPGTGKTQVLGARIAHILKKTDTQAENIICLTFTEAATIALRQRLIKFIGSEAYKVNIYTYHGFCNMVIQENKDLFGLQDLDPISDLEVEEVLREIIDELPNDNVLKRFVGEVYYDSRNFKKLFGLLKKDNLGASDIATKIKKKLDEVETDPAYRYKRNGKDFKKGDLKQKDVDRLKESLTKLQEASNLLDVYNAKLKVRKRYDFNDMLYWVLNALRTNEELLLRYQEQFLYFLVDEYQDTSGIQNDLLYTLIDYWENPNVFVVGDDDQSIYKFQGANVENIFDFYKKYENHVKLVVLDKNYRSSQNILDGSNHLIEQNHERLVGKVPGLTKKIEAANNEVANIPDALHVVEYPNLYQEIVSITTKLKHLKEKGVNLANVGILYRNHRQSEDLIKYLEAENISYNVAKTQNVLEVPLVHQLNVFLTYMSLELKGLDLGQHLLFEILHYHSFEHLSAYEVSKISAVFSKDKKRGWRAIFNEKIDEIELGIKSKLELKSFVADVEYWLKEMHNMTLQTLVERIMSKMGFVARALAAKDATFQIQSLKTYYNFLKEETSRDPFLSLKDFLAKIDLLEANGLGLKLNKIIHGIDGVNLMTVHGSKGLEFEYVYLVGCTESKWEKDNNSLPFKLNELIPGVPKDAMEEESRRLFYVALTRAKKHIEVSYPLLDEKNKMLVQSLFVSQLVESGAVQVKKQEADEKELLHFFDFMLTEKVDSFVELVKQDWVVKEIENFRLSATNLNSYLKCPVTFFYQNVIRVPSAKGESMTFGTAIHYALDGLFKEYKTLASEDEAKELLSRRFTAAMNSSKEAFTEQGLERRLFYGKDVLHKYYEHYRSTWSNTADVQTELYLKNCEIDGVPIRGQIDKVIIEENTVNVVDFKTGQYKYGKTKVHPPQMYEDNPDEKNFEKRYGGDYWRQIMFYKALIESDQTKHYKVISGEIDFIEPDGDSFRKEKIMIDDEGYQFVRRQIVDTFNRIRNLEFDKGCEKEDCQWCNFNKRYNQHLEYRGADLLTINTDEMEER